MSETQRIPVDVTETKNAKPAALQNTKEPPAFQLKTVDRRQREAMEYAMAEEGLSRVDDEGMRELTIVEVCRLWQCKEDDEKVQRIKGYWSALDDYVEDVSLHQSEIEASALAEEEPPEALPPFEHPDADHFHELMIRLAETSDPIRKAGVANLRYRREFPRFTIAHAVTGWAGLDIEPVFDGGVLDINCVVAMQQELVEKFGKEAGETAYLELSMETLKRIYLNKVTEKNSKSPAPLPWTPEALKGNGQDEISGKSPASESSDEIPAASSIANPSS